MSLSIVVVANVPCGRIREGERGELPHDFNLQGLDNITKPFGLS